MGGEELAVLRCGHALAAQQLVEEIRTALPPGLGCLKLVLPDANILGADRALESVHNLFFITKKEARQTKRTRT